jgi:hypothetical protein
MMQCKSLNDDALSWLGGTIGHFKVSCRKLESLNAEGLTSIHDVGLIALGSGCHNIKFLNLAGCNRITDAGIAGLTKGCKKLMVVNLFECNLLGNDTCKALSANCHHLRSLNIGKIDALKFNDIGLNVLSAGCHELQSLNVTGLREITEDGMCHIAQNCKGLMTLNIR